MWGTARITLPCGQTEIQNPVRRFECFTADLYRLAEWLARCGVKTVAIAYASHCTSFGRREAFSINRNLFDSLTPLAFLGGSDPGSLLLTIEVHTRRLARKDLQTQIQAVTEKTWEGVGRRLLGTKIAEEIDLILKLGAAKEDCRYVFTFEEITKI